MKPHVMKLGHNLWYCLSEYNVISFRTWQEALAEANRVAYVQSLRRALGNFNTHMWGWVESRETALFEKGTNDSNP